MKCNCSYLKFKLRGYNVIGHSYTCPMNPNYEMLKPKQLFKPPKGDNPYKEVNRAKEDNPYAKKIKRKQSNL